MQKARPSSTILCPVPDVSAAIFWEWRGITAVSAVILQTLLLPLLASPVKRPFSPGPLYARKHLSCRLVTWLIHLKWRWTHEVVVAGAEFQFKGVTEKRHRQCDGRHAFLRVRPRLITEAFTKRCLFLRGRVLLLPP